MSLFILENCKAKNDFGDGDEDTDDDENNDNPVHRRHLRIGDAVAENFGKVEEDAAALIEHLDPWRDFEVLADSAV